MLMHLKGVLSQDCRSNLVTLTTVAILLSVFSISTFSNAAPVLSPDEEKNQKVDDFVLLDELNDILSRKESNVLIPPSQRAEENDSIAANDVEILDNLRNTNHPLENNVDVVSVLSLAKTNDLFSQMYEKKSGFIKRFVTSKSRDLFSDDYFIGELFFGKPGLLFDLSGVLHLHMKLLNRSSITKYSGNGELLNKTYLNNNSTVASTTCKLQKIMGKEYDHAVALDFTDVEWIMNLTIADGRKVPDALQISFKSDLAEAMSQTYGKEYVLGSVIENPNSPRILSGLTPNSFAMKVLRSTSNDGNGVLVIGIGCNGRNVTYESILGIDGTVDLVPKGRDTALYITNRNLYQSFLKDTLNIPHLGIVQDSAQHEYYISGGRFSLGSYKTVHSCDRAIVGGCKEPSMDTKMVTSATVSVPNPGTYLPPFSPMLPISFGDNRLTIQGCYSTGGRVSGCTTLTQNPIFTTTVKLAFSVDQGSSDDLVVSASATHELNGINKGGWWNPGMGASLAELESDADSWANKDAMAHLKTLMDKASTDINLFGVNHILFPENNILKYETVYLSRDLVLFGSMKNKLDNSP